MSLTSAIAVYFIIWWLTLFAVLPWGVRTQEESGEIEPGTTPSAPARPMMKKKLLATTIVASLIFGLLYLAIASGWLTLDGIPFGPTFK